MDEENIYGYATDPETGQLIIPGGGNDVSWQNDQQKASWPADEPDNNEQPGDNFEQPQPEPPVVNNIQTPEQLQADTAIIQREIDNTAQGMESAPDSPIAQEVQQAAERVLAGYEQEQALAESQGLIAQGGGVYVTPEQREQSLQESQTRVDTRMLLGSIESQGGIQGAIEAGNIDKVREAIDKGLYTVKDAQTGLDMPMTQLDLVDTQIAIANQHAYEQAFTTLKEDAPSSITPDGILIKKALDAGVSETTLRTLLIPDSVIQDAKNAPSTGLTGPRYGMGLVGPPNLSEYGGVVRPPIESFIAQYGADHPIKEPPKGMGSFDRLNWTDDQVARQRIDATKAYLETYGAKGLAAGTALAIGEVFTPAFKLLEPSVGKDGLTTTDKVIIAVQAGAVLIPYVGGITGSIVKNTPIGKIPVRAAKWTNEAGQTFQPAEKITLAARYFSQKFSPEYLDEIGRIAHENNYNEAQWIRAMNAQAIYNENLGAAGQSFPGGWQPPGWNIQGAKPTDWIPPGWSSSNGRATPPDAKATDADVARLLGDVDFGGGARGSVATMPRTAEPITAPRPVTIPRPFTTPSRPIIEPYPISPNTPTPVRPFTPLPIPSPIPERRRTPTPLVPGLPAIPIMPPGIPSPTPKITPSPTPVIEPQPIPGATPAPGAVPTPADAPTPVETPAPGATPAPTPTSEPTPVTEITPTPEPTPVIPEEPPVVPVIPEVPPPPPPPPPVKKIPPPFALGGSGSLYRGGDYSGSTIATSLKGQVRDILTNLPIPKALVKVISSAGAKAQKLTNKKGMYQFSDINPDYYTVISTKEGYDPIQAKTLVNVGENRLDIKPRQSVTRTIQAPNLTTIVSPPALSPNLRAMPPAVSSRPGIIALKRGREWAVIYPPYQPHNLVHMIQPPPGAAIAKSIGQMFKLVQSMGGNGSVLVNLYQGNKHDDARWNRRTINVQDPAALEKWLKRPGRGDVVGKDTPMYKPRKPARAVMIKRSQV